MNIKEVLKYCDHTNLSITATAEDIDRLVKEAERFETASVCIQPCFVAYVKEKSNINICTVVGFPNGYSTMETKVYETKNAIENGANEIDMVININLFKAGQYSAVLDEINRIKDVCQNHILKVIVETAFLSEDEIIKISEIVSQSKADYIKTSTGFASRGASFNDILIFRQYAKGKKIKAAGGIRTLEDAIKYINLGCDRLGTSSLVKLAIEMGEAR